MSKLIKRKDGSYSKRGLWDNIRANKGSGKKPTKDMLKQEAKIKKEENMKSMYKKGGKNPKNSFMEESKEINFDAPGVKPPMKYIMGGGTETGMEVNARQNQAIGEATMAGKKKMGGKKMMYKKGGFKKYEEGGKKTGDPIKATTDSTNYFKKEQELNYKNAKTNAEFGLKDAADENMKKASQAFKDEMRQKNKGKYGYDKDGHPVDLEKQILLEKAKKMGHDTIEEYRNSNWGYGKNKKMTGGVKKYKTGGAKTMEPGGGGRFAAMVGKLKGQGKSKESAEAIAASAGRKKYGKSKFQAMAAAGKKKMGGKKC